MSDEMVDTEASEASVADDAAQSSEAGGAQPTERPVPSERVLFVHIPKTAGVSLYLALEAWATPQRSVRFLRGGLEDIKQLTALSDEELSQLRLISGHLSYVDFRKRLGEEWWPIAVLRDPVERALSLFSFVKSTPTHPWFERVSDMDLDEFLVFDRDRPFSVNQQCMFIAHRPDAEEAFETLRLKFALACTLEHFSEFVERLGMLLEYPLAVTRENVSPSRLSRADVGTKTLRTIEEANEADQALYERVRETGLMGYLANAD